MKKTMKVIGIFATGMALTKASVDYVVHNRMESNSDMSKTIVSMLIGGIYGSIVRKTIKKLYK